MSTLELWVYDEWEQPHGKWVKTNVKNIFTGVPISIWCNLCIDCVLEPLQYSFMKDILASKVSCYGLSYSDFSNKLWLHLLPILQDFSHPCLDQYLSHGIIMLSFMWKAMFQLFQRGLERKGKYMYVPSPLF